MAILTHMDGIPLFSTVVEAYTWSSKMGYQLNEYHTHVYDGKTGYMAGRDHAEVYGLHSKSEVVSPTRATQEGERVFDPTTEEQPQESGLRHFTYAERVGLF